jgi:hypothetical protein
MKECSGVERPLQIWCALCLLEVDDDVIYACWALNRPDDGGILCLFWNVFSASEELVLWTHMQPPEWEKVSFHQLIFTVIVLWVALDFGPPTHKEWGFVSVQRCPLKGLETENLVVFLCLAHFHKCCFLVSVVVGFWWFYLCIFFSNKDLLVLLCKCV